MEIFLIALMKAKNILKNYLFKKFLSRSLQTFCIPILRHRVAVSCSVLTLVGGPQEGGPQEGGQSNDFAFVFVFEAVVFLVLQYLFSRFKRQTRSRPLWASGIWHLASGIGHLKVHNDYSIPSVFAISIYFSIWILTSRTFMALFEHLKSFI